MQHHCSRGFVFVFILLDVVVVAVCCWMFVIQVHNQYSSQLVQGLRPPLKGSPQLAALSECCSSGAFVRGIRLHGFGNKEVGMGLGL